MLPALAGVHDLKNRMIDCSVYSTLGQDDYTLAKFIQFVSLTYK
ncbi:hypothetical protein [Acinetobacter seifertii]|jgi:hypothetical protein|nr:hypothetical protein [Acinetobacter seifertii]